MKQYRILITKPAADDLLEIAEYIGGELRDPANANKLVGDIKKAVMSLAQMPTRHAIVADERLAACDIRKVPVGKHIVFYMVSEKDGTVTVIRILYGKRLWEYML
jgi:toxin ParE1/3/4